MIRYSSNIISVEKNNFFKKIISSTKLIGFEGFIWIAALLYLALFINPNVTHFTICPLSNLGFDHCPGCGLGNSISFLFAGNLWQSLDSHILGLQAVIIILHRIYSIIKFNLKKVKTTQ